MKRLNGTDPQASVYVDASAGSGKTKLLVDRIIRMLLYGISPSKILCITFTNAAADEMYERLRKQLLIFLTIREDELKKTLLDLNGFMPSDSMLERARSLFAVFVTENPKIQTLHGFCSKILQKMKVIDLNDNVKTDTTRIIDDKEKLDLLHESFNEVIFENHAVTAELKTLLMRYEASYLFDLICEFWNGIASSNSKQFFDLFSENALEEDILKMLSEKVYDFFQISNEQSKGKIIKNYITSCNTNLLAEAAEVLDQSDNITSKAAAVEIRKFLEEPSEKTFFEYLNTLLTSDFKPRARLPLSESTAKEFESIKDFLLDEQIRLCDSVELLHCLAAAEINAAFSIFAWAVLKNFNAKKQQQSLFEYSDLIRQTINLIQESEDRMTLLYSIDVTIDHIMIDEAQDLSEMQWLMIKTITDEFFSGIGTTSGNRTIFIVGDFKQAIFGFQGAAPELFQEVKKFYREKVLGMGKKWYEIQLDTCYRCAPEILEIVDRVCNTEKFIEAFEGGNRVIAHKSVGSPGYGVLELHPLPPTSIEPTNQKLSWHLPKEQKETSIEKDDQWLVAQNIAEKVENWLRQGKRFGPGSEQVMPQDILILLRKRSKLQDCLVQALNYLKVPVSNLAAKEFGNSLVLYDLLAALQFVLQPLDDMNLIALLKSPPFDFDESKIMEIAIGRGTSVWERVKSITLLQNMITNSKKMDLQSFFQWYLDDVYKIFNDEVSRFMDYVFSYCSSINPLNISLSGFMIWLHNFLSKKQQKIYDNKSVRITTVHSAKGLEAPIVILADADSSESFAPVRFAYEGDRMILNTKNSGKAVKEMIARWNEKTARENMRLLYVAMTRPKYELHVFGSSKSKHSWYSTLREASASKS